jgi:SAM-dependent methyltransferase
LSAGENGQTDKKWLSIGTIDYFVDFNFLKKYGFTSAEEHATHKSYVMGSRDWEKSTKRLCSAFVRHFGYTHYQELDINGRADLRLDLNFPIPPELKGAFDLVWDAGSIEHIMNIGQAINNMIDLVKPGGIILHNQGIGDQMNAGYWTISPNFYLDFYAANGCEILKIFLVDRRNGTLDYKEVTTKGSSTGMLIPLYRYPGYFMRLIRQDLAYKLIFSHRLANRIVDGLSRRLPLLGKVINGPLGRTSTGGPDWGIIVIAKKKSDKPARSYPIQNIYRHTLQPN